MGKMRNSEVAREYERQPREKWEELRDTKTDDVETDWERMKVAVEDVTQKECSMKRVGRMRKGTGCWNVELEQMC